MRVESRRLDLLSQRERECLRLAFRQRTSKEIGLALNLSPSTVKGYIAQATIKLGARDRREAAAWLAEAEGLVMDPTPWTGPSGRVERERPDAPGVTVSGARDWRSLLPFRQSGASHHDLSLPARALWPFVLAAALAVGFGMLAVGADVVSRMLRAFF